MIILSLGCWKLFAAGDVLGSIRLRSGGTRTVRRCTRDTTWGALKECLLLQQPPPAQPIDPQAAGSGTSCFCIEKKKKTARLICKATQWLQNVMINWWGTNHLVARIIIVIIYIYTGRKPVDLYCTIILLWYSMSIAKFCCVPKSCSFLFHTLPKTWEILGRKKKKPNHTLPAPSRLGFGLVS